MVSMKRQKLKEKTLVGFDGEEKIFLDKNDFLLFIKNHNTIGEECFLVAREETLLNTQNLSKSERGDLK